ncbi:MAG: SDR family oxidoreductase [Pseudonocardia sp.]|nr:SDR family oxidoreductase [Pseudonocardia sp.]
MFRLDGQVALVTGASSGLGARFARVLHDAGAEIVLTARRSDRLTSVADDLGSRVATLSGDLRRSEVREQLIQLVTTRYSRLDILINNAGTCDAGPLQDQDLDELRAVLDLNLVAALDLCRLAAPLLFASSAASVINVASIYGLISSRAPMTGYNVSKAALAQLTRHLAAQWGTRGVRVNALAPGFFPTDLTGQLTDPHLRSAIEHRTLLGRTPDPAELDGPLLFLASHASSYVTGHILAVDGGWTAC